MYPLTDAQAERKSEYKRVSTGFSFRLHGVLFELSVLGNYKFFFVMEHINRICVVARNMVEVFISLVYRVALVYNPQHLNLL